MIVFVIQVIVVLVLLCILLGKLKRNPLDTMPGPKPYPFVGNVLQLDFKKLYIQLADFAKQYGGIYKIRLFSKPVVVVNDQNAIHRVLIKQSAEFAGRPKTYRTKMVSYNFSDIVLTDPGPEHTGRRKAVHRYIKQYSTEKIKTISQIATDDLIQRFADQHGDPVDPRDFLFNCAADVIAILLVGEKLTPKKIKEIKELLDRTVEAMGPGMGLLLDRFPFLRFAGIKVYKDIQEYSAMKYAMVTEWKKQKPSDGFISFIQSMSEEEKMTSFLATDRSQVVTAWSFIANGVSTTTITLTCLMNVLCHYPDVQEILRNEVRDVVGPLFDPVKDQDRMPYLRATILEIGRFASVAPFAAPHKSMQTCKLDEHTIPKDTMVFVNLWALHHDEKLWDEPFTFKPERFLDDDGQLVPADHPNRKNAMPFSAGHRVCVGEALAVSRMFLITARILQNFTVLPESTVEKQPSCDPRDMKMGFLLSPKPFKVRFIQVSD